LEYRLREIMEPRPNRVHVLRVDLAGGKIQPAVVIAADPDGDGPAEAALTDPFKLASDRSVIVFVNTNPWDSLSDRTGRRDRSWFEGQPVDIQGLAVSGGRARSPAGPGGTSVWFDDRGRVFLGDVPEDRPVAEGMAGFQKLVGEGAVVVPPGGSPQPRTAIGVDRAGSVMWLVVVDGRQAQYSEGMTLRELGGIMRELGCWNATNMDGGGSSVMGLAGADGKLRVVNSPSDRRSGAANVRPLPMILTIRQTPGSRLPDATDEASMKQSEREQNAPAGADKPRR
jgi:hypothetical protein